MARVGVHCIDGDYLKVSKLLAQFLDKTDAEESFEVWQISECLEVRGMVKQDIFEPMPSHPMAHASTLTELPDGKLLCAFYAGTYETAS